MAIVSNFLPCIPTSTIGVNAGDVVATCYNDPGKPTSHYERFTIQSTVATLDVQATLDGTNWVTVAVQDLTATASSTFVTTLTVGKIGLLTGKFVGVRIRQSGATPANGVLLGG